MKEITGNIWDFYTSGHVVVLPTNGYVKTNGAAVMGRGLALDWSHRFPQFPFEFGWKLKAKGNVVMLWASHRIITFPVNHNWWEMADLQLIRESVRQLHLLNLSHVIYMPQVGCGNGRQPYELVRPILSDLPDNYFVIVRQ